MNKAESADLIMKLYDLRREEKMREARNWFLSFFPESVDDIMSVMIDEKTSAYYRMVTSYWDMAASFVNQDAIDEEMFNETSGEHIIVFSKVAPFLEDLRARFQNPKMFANLEKLIMRMPDASEMLTKRRETMKMMMQKRAEMSKSAL